MTKQEFLDNLAKRVNAVSTPILDQANVFDDNLYHVSVRKILGDVVSYENIRFVVIDEGEPAESTLFLETNLIVFDNVHENKELRDKLYPTVPAVAKPIEEIPNKP